MEKESMFDFITDLDDYFCEKYANYDKLCVLEGYRMPKMQTSEVREDGRTYAYTLPANTMRLALQENKASLLKKVKETAFDKTFSFSFQPLGFFARLRNKYSRYGFLPWLKVTLKKYAVNEADVGAELNIAEDIWQGICKGKYLPSKNTILSLALTAHISLEDTGNLLLACGYEWEYAVIKDVVVSYLLAQKVFNREMINAALEEYKVNNLFLK